ncbi:hypothetical protein BpHYR1_016310 [Brachionus plicatilis]|uniref:Uncharacterized protein n=1 Tax=Brachionus plicatilis TaxID=10195 RepID=A0A3M7P8W5_BRAPC|nr:hypothetical protein BpHYR1_016310 [Brachionus plicatilis]
MYNGTASLLGLDSLWDFWLSNKSNSPESVFLGAVSFLPAISAVPFMDSFEKSSELGNLLIRLEDDSNSDLPEQNVSQY